MVFYFPEFLLVSRFPFFFKFSYKVYLSFGMKHSSHRYENYLCSQVYLKQYFIIVMTPTSTNVRIHHHQAGPYHQHKTLYRRTPNLPCYCNNKYESIFDMFFRINLFVQNRQCNDKKKEKKTRSTKHCQKTND